MSHVLHTEEQLKAATRRITAELLTKVIQEWELTDKDQDIAMGAAVIIVQAVAHQQL